MKLWPLFLFVLLAACAKPPCPGFERISYGSGCIVAGHPEKFVERINCEDCGG